MADWKRLAEHVIDRRVELGYKRRPAFVADAGISLRTLGDIERGRRASYDRGTLSALEQTLQWAPGSITAILDGGDPTEQPRHSATVAARPQPAAGSDEALIRVMRSDLDDKTKAKIVRMLIAEQQRFERERAERAEELIRAFRDDG